jgi:altronate dehydratase large subunit
MLNNLMGYKRPDGRFGIRNHVAVLSAMDNCNGIVKKIAAQLKDVLPIPIWYGRGQFGQDQELTFNTLAGLGANPNLHSVLVVSLEPVSAKKLADEIRRRSQKTVISINVQEIGNSIDAVAEGTRIAAELISTATEQQREPIQLSDLVLGVECGGTDTTSGIASNPVLGSVADYVIDNGGTVILTETSEFLGAEHILAKRAKNQEVHNRILGIVDNVELEANRRGVSILGANPVPDNIAGGITTIEEKSLGAIIKGGTKEIQGVLNYADQSTGGGLFLMDTPAPACESMTGIAAGGAQAILFSTGKGNIIGNPLSPTIKVTANPETASTMQPNIDLDVSEVFLGNQMIEEGGELLLDYLRKVINGKKTKAEILGEEEIALNKIQPTV